jgi:hypothetical protein
MIGNHDHFSKWNVEAGGTYTHLDYSYLLKIS